MNPSSILIDFVVEFDSASNLHACFQVLERSVEKLGFLGLVYSLIPIGLNALANDSPVFLASSKFSLPFLNHYLAGNFAADDFTIKRLFKGDLTVNDWWAEERKGTLLAREKHVIEVAKTDYHITNGISIPLLSTPQHIAGASVISEENTSHFSMLLEERLLMLQTIIKLFHHRVYGDIEYRKAFYVPLISKLTEREKRVLHFTGSGQAYKAIGNNYGMTASSASNARSDLFKKLEVKNVSELAYITGLHNLLEMI
ncbi:MAG: autoinducer binding domain-containing protein [Methylobacter sp.]|nr:autoinducer binding domain-containing protein [Methylobacter sp.]MDP2097710.1 autoinducer binding domain-containing protein [Methylobacter sp.]MDP2428843.1 autoinducer binding domain-containing protein [Methylobacter sp.]MDP3055477.1 autoinducer binding domain-containing protein [Methylobacter sp.]MDP3362342.1 autoinducer binding domain-containing protein [Methylobacter sp.]